MSEIAIKCAYTRLMPVAELKLRIAPNNPNKHSPEQIERLRLLFRHNGVRHPIIIDVADGTIAAGHGRLEAAEAEGMTEYPVDEQSFADADERYQFMVADNAIAAWAELDLGAINLALPEMGPFDIDLLAIQDFTVDVAERSETDIEVGAPGEVTDGAGLAQCPNCGHMLK